MVHFYKKLNKHIDCSVIISKLKEGTYIYLPIT